MNEGGREIIYLYIYIHVLIVFCYSYRVDKETKHSATNTNNENHNNNNNNDNNKSNNQHPSNENNPPASLLSIKAGESAYVQLIPLKPVVVESTGNILSRIILICGRPVFLVGMIKEVTLPDKGSCPFTPIEKL